MRPSFPIAEECIKKKKKKYSTTGHEGARKSKMDSEGEKEK